MGEKIAVPCVLPGAVGVTEILKCVLWVYGKNIRASKCSVTKIAPQASSREAEGLMIRHQGFLAGAEGKSLVNKGKEWGRGAAPLYVTDATYQPHPM